jgi:hypothetical protein
VDLLRGKAGNITIGEHLCATNGDYWMPPVPAFNVTGQSESSVRREIKDR